MLLTSEKLATFSIQVPESFSLEVTGVQLSTSDLLQGDVFVAVQGKRGHGIQFLDKAIAAGAVAVLTDPDNLPDFDFPTLIHPDPRAVAGVLAAFIYETPSSKMELFGVTGTNGKTSTVTYIQQLLTAMGEPCGLSASTNRIVGTEVLESNLTSPEAPMLHSLLARMRAAGQFAAAIEVSAQALVRHRVSAVGFECVGFTNLSRDHLDDFGNMEAYLQAKAKLFTADYAKRAVVMVDDVYGQALAKSVDIPVVTLGKSSGDWRYRFEDGILNVSSPDAQNFEVSFEAGDLMAKNFALALTMVAISGRDPEQIRQALPNAQGQVPGRLELVSDLLPKVFVDYAHTPDGVSKAAQEVGSKGDFLTIVLGASGNRDQGKRSEMSQAAAGADLLVITDQHPRDEDPALIRASLLASAQNSKVIEIADPAEAIAYAIAQTPESGSILWCGPGNLNYREIKGEKVPFDARRIAREILESR